MYSRCPHCQTQQSVSAEQLRTSRGLLRCSACGERFDALVSLSEQADEEFKQDNTADFLPNPPKKPTPKVFWKVGGVLVSLILLAQILYFEGDNLIRQPRLRVGLLAICERLGCRLPEYKNLAEWAVSHSDFQAISDKRYVFSAAITNQAAFPQACPDIKLVLRDFTGQVVAERVFLGREYAAVDLLAANETAEISLAIATPSGVGKIGGYTFTLL
ncbi:MAG: zinc-ribbon domain-containing protein [Methylococcaceae bacterium]|nr:zinc-ribbon domain-containing protein [Methylococcaceae bacterium]